MLPLPNSTPMGLPEAKDEMCRFEYWVGFPEFIVGDSDG